MVPTPAFMPVGTRGSVRVVAPRDLRAVGTDIVLANAFHLMLRPGDEVVAGLGGLHGFMGWDGPILTDSGGSRCSRCNRRSMRPVPDSARRTTGVGSTSPRRRRSAFRSGSVPTSQWCSTSASPYRHRRPMSERRWSGPCAGASAPWRRTDVADQALFGIVQGGIDPLLRGASARATVGLGVPGFGIGGLSVGETPEERRRALEATVAELPGDKVRYVMGLGDPLGVLDAVATGTDLFDCVWPTRLARHGKILTPDGDYHLKGARFRKRPRPASLRVRLLHLRHAFPRLPSASPRHWRIARPQPAHGPQLALHARTDRRDASWPSKSVDSMSTAPRWRPGDFHRTRPPSNLARPA